MAEDQMFDVIVVGAGAVGENVADRAVKGGLSAAIVEAELVGGECSYWACMPSKALLRPGQAVAEARAVPGAAEAVTGAIDVGAALARRDSFTSHWNDEGQVRWLQGAGVTLVRGHARLTGERSVMVEAEGGPTVSLRAAHAVVLSVGSVPVIPPVEGLAEARPWTTREATSAHRVPDSLVVLGGGVAGCELSQAWARFGASVTLLEPGERLLSAQEPFAGDLVGAAMERMGVDVRTGTSAAAVRRRDDGRVEVRMDDGTTVEAAEILVAAGRRPCTDDVGLEHIGLEPGSWLAVDDTMLVTDVEGGWLYATGDVNHRALLTHQGKYQARVCGDVIAARARGEVDPTPWSPYAATADHASVPGVVFTDPEVASVGYTERRARQAGIDVRVVDYQIGRVAGASVFADGYEGQARIVVDEARKVIVGATFAGPGVAELLHSATVAVVGEVPLDRLWHAVPSYPTISEVWLRLLETYGL